MINFGLLVKRTLYSKSVGLSRITFAITLNTRENDHMDPTLSKAFLLLFVGMITVIVILSLVVLSGKMLISIINRFFPLPPEKAKKKRTKIAASPDRKLNPKKLAAIIAAVEAITGGRGTVTKVEKV
ncbi:MAG: oxaloacetate decarboxylase gamma subunit [Polaribacter sp.]|jgi:oxaloacetate decarboxylase gamma subunit